MASYHLWHPAYVTAEPLTLELFVTQGDALMPPGPAPGLARSALDALGLGDDPRTQRVDAVRTHYFSSHRDASEDWRDRWDLSWRLRMTFVTSRAASLPEPPGWGYYDLDAVGATEPPSEDGPWPCLLVADVRDAEGLEAAEGVAADAFPDAECVRGRAFTRRPQLRCEAGPFPRAWYEDGAAEAEAALQALAAAGASVRSG